MKEGECERGVMLLLVAIVRKYNFTFSSISYVFVLSLLSNPSSSFRLPP